MEEKLKTLVEAEHLVEAIDGLAEVDSFGLVESLAKLSDADRAVWTARITEAVRVLKQAQDRLR
ncbi:MAG: hypothetical protein ACLQDV_17070 [Candidatus Binataceae bacterium]